MSGADCVRARTAMQHSMSCVASPFTCGTANLLRIGSARRQRINITPLFTAHIMCALILLTECVQDATVGMTEPYPDTKVDENLNGQFFK
jgi:hypothetical protein